MSLGQRRKMVDRVPLTVLNFSRTEALGITWRLLGSSEQSPAGPSPGKRHRPL